MIRSTAFAEQIEQVFKPSARGIIGFVDDVLNLCRDHQMRFDFRDGHCAVGRLGTNGADSLDIPLQKSVFRAALARVAALCNAQHPQSVTPYHGEGEIVVPSPLAADLAAPTKCHVSFTNTAAEQRLVVRFAG
jgi:hypothetical protein